jgi:two-component system NtrC family response regulator
MSDDKPKLLIVDDDTGIQRQLRWALDQYEVILAGDRKSALDLFEEETPPVVTIDLGLPPDPDGATEGFATLDAILQRAPETKVIVVTGNEDHGNALRAVASGAYDFYRKPINLEEFTLIIKRALQLYALEEENRRLARTQRNMPLTGIVTSDPEMLKICRRIEKVAPTRVSVLLLGESGTGKELLARAVHELSPRAQQSFSAINCAAIPETLMESELFGHEKGAFTGAIRQIKGKVEMADGGTLFLDEIGDVPLAIQVKLLRFLQERVIERVGGRQLIPVDVRIVCATNQDLKSLIAQGRFREDLYYRLSELVINIPPLRDRGSDAELLAQSFLVRYNRELGRTVRGFTGEALAAISLHNWPGNVRELENRIKRGVIMCDGVRLLPSDLDLADPEGIPPVLSLAAAREEAERREIPRALTRAEGNITQAAKLLGISRPTLYELIRHHGLRTE